MKTEFMTFEEYHNESPVAMEGDWKPKDLKPSYLSKYGADTHWGEILGVLNIAGEVLELRKHDTANTFILGKFEDVPTPNHKERTSEIKFRRVGVVNFTERKHLGRILSKTNPNYYNIIDIDSIYIETKYRQLGIATELHIWLVKELGFAVMGGGVQYFGYRKMWSRLSKDSNLRVDVIDTKKREVIEVDVNIQQGEDLDIDKRFYSQFPNKTKEHIRPILTLSRIKGT